MRSAIWLINNHFGLVATVSNWKAVWVAEYPANVDITDVYHAMRKQLNDCSVTRDGQTITIDRNTLTLDDVQPLILSYAGCVQIRKIDGQHWRTYNPKHTGFIDSRTLYGAINTARSYV